MRQPNRYWLMQIMTVSTATTAVNPVADYDRIYSYYRGESGQAILMPDWPINELRVALVQSPGNVSLVYQLKKDHSNVAMACKWDPT